MRFQDVRRVGIKAGVETKTGGRNRAILSRRSRRDWAWMLPRWIDIQWYHRDQGTIVLVQRLTVRFLTDLAVPEYGPSGQISIPWECVRMGWKGDVSHRLRRRSAPHPFGSGSSKHAVSVRVCTAPRLCPQRPFILVVTHSRDYYTTP